MTRPVIPAPSMRVVEQHSGVVLSGEGLRAANDRLQVVAVGQLEELLDAEIPCGGWSASPLIELRPCGRSAVLHSLGHGCSSDNPGRYKCIPCWQQWYAAMWEKNRGRNGFNRCDACKRQFPTPESFSDYRPF